MAHLYTVDGDNRLKPGQVLTCKPDWLSEVPQDDAGRANLDILGRLFPSGLSAHGKRCLIDEPLTVDRYPFDRRLNLTDAGRTVGELVLELVRRICFPELPSRFSSVFASRSIDEALWFRTKCRHPASPIYQIDAEVGFVGDLKLISLGNCAAEAWLNAERYWRGEASDDPHWEVLVIFPITVERLYPE